jgi:YfiH family protein
MIRPPGFRGVAYSGAVEGDLRENPTARRLVSRSLGINPQWATVHQVHGGRVVRATGPGVGGEADALFTVTPGVPLAVFTADCLAVAIEGADGVGIAHAGWRGIVAGVVERMRGDMESVGLVPTRAAIGPGIGPCCFEVGEEVAAQFEDHATVTTWGTTSVDLSSAVAAQLDGLQVWQAGICTKCSGGFFSHRRDGTPARAAGIAWVS